MAHGDARQGKWRGNMRVECVASNLALYLRTWSIHGLSADAHTSGACSRLNWRPRRFKWTRPLRWKTKSGFCACAITFQTCSTSDWHRRRRHNWWRDLETKESWRNSTIIKGLSTRDWEKATETCKCIWCQCGVLNWVATGYSFNSLLRRWR